MASKLRDLQIGTKRNVHKVRRTLPSPRATSSAADISGDQGH